MNVLDVLVGGAKVKEVEVRGRGARRSRQEEAGQGRRGRTSEKGGAAGAREKDMNPQPSPMMPDSTWKHSIR